MRLETRVLVLVLRLACLLALVVGQPEYGRSEEPTREQMKEGLAKTKVIIEKVEALIGKGKLREACEAEKELIDLLRMLKSDAELPETYRQLAFLEDYAELYDDSVVSLKEGIRLMEAAERHRAPWFRKSRLTEMRIALRNAQSAIKMTEDERKDRRAGLDALAKAETLFNRRQYNTAETKAYAAIELLERVAPESDYLSSAKVVRGESLRELGRFADAEKEVRAALELDQKLSGDDDSRTAKHWETLAKVLGSPNRPDPDHRAALDCSMKALKILRTADGETIGSTLNQYRTVVDRCVAARNYEQGIEVGEKFLAALAAAYPDNPEALMVPLRHVGDVYYLAGKPSVNTEYLKKALAIADKVGHPQAALIRVTLAGHLLSLRLDDEAGKYLTEARKAYEAQKNATPTELLYLWTKIGNWHQLRHELPDAQRAFDKGREVAEQIRRPTANDDLHTAVIRASLGNLAHLNGDHEKGREELAAGIALLERNPQDPHTRAHAPGFYLQLGRAEIATGRREGGRKSFERALDIVQAARLPTSDGLLFNASLDLGDFWFASGNRLKAKQHYEQAHKAYHSLLERHRAILSDHALLYITSFIGGVGIRDRILSLQRGDKNATDADRYQLVWETRATVADTAVRRLPAAEASPEARAVWDKLREVRLHLSRQDRGEVPGEKEGPKNEVRKLRQERDRLQGELAELSAPFANRLKSAPATVRTLAEQLPNDVAVVDLIRTERSTPAKEGKALLKSEMFYEAFVIRKSPGEPRFTVHLVELPTATELDAVTRKWIDAIQKRDQKGFEKDGAELRKSLWEPIEKHLAGCTTVIIIPDGPLAGLPWSAMPGKEAGRYVLHDYAVSTALSGKHLVYLLLPAGVRPARAGTVELLLVDGVDYGKSLDWKPAPKRIWKELPGTVAEGDALSRLHNRPKAQQRLTKEEASVEAVAERLQRTRIAHLATHGAFAPDRTRNAAPRNPFSPFTDVTLGAAYFDVPPLTLSTLVLAGANREPGAGLLTAEQIADLDLSGLELVVLSACETAQGLQAPGEGTFSLERALATAGARTVVSSLWSVEDTSTRVLMEEFYRNLWGDGKDKKPMAKLQALRQAQLMMLHKLRDPKTGELRGEPVVIDGLKVVPVKDPPKGERLAPFFWAAFGLSGDWR